MRWVLLSGVLSGLASLAGCAREELAARPVNGADLSGEWTLNVADSDDAMRLTQAALASATASAGAGGTTGSNGGRGQRARGGGLGPAGPLGPAPPPVMTLDEALRWPGRELVISQSAAGVTFRSGGREETCRPGAGQAEHAPRRKSDPRSHDAPDQGRGDAPPPRCGWDQATLVVQPRDIAEDHAPYDQAFTLSEDRQRLIEVVTFRAGRSSGFTASRVWDRAPAAKKPGAPAAAGAATAPGASPPAGAPGTP